MNGAIPLLFTCFHGEHSDINFLV